MTMIDIQIESKVERVLLRPSTKRGQEWAEAKFGESAATSDGGYGIAPCQLPNVLNTLISIGLEVEFR